MKKLISAVLLLSLCLALCSCSGTMSPASSEEVPETTDSIESLSQQTGIDITIPSTAKNAEFAIINKIIAQVNFSFNSTLYVYRASKLASGVQLHKIEYDEKSVTEITIGERATVSVYTADDAGRVAEWYSGGTYYSLYSKKSVTDDAFTELCDLLIP